MNWTWSLRTPDGGMEGLEFARCLTAGDLERVLVHAAPAALAVEVVDDERRLVASGEVRRDGDYAPMTELRLTGGSVRRRELWPGPDEVGTPVLLAGGEVGVLLAWQDGDDRSWWRWSVEFSNHLGRPADWRPPAG